MLEYASGLKVPSLYSRAIYSARTYKPTKSSFTRTTTEEWTYYNKAELDFSKDYICLKLPIDRELQQVKSLIFCKVLQLPLCKERTAYKTFSITIEMNTFVLL